MMMENFFTINWHTTIRFEEQYFVVHNVYHAQKWNVQDFNICFPPLMAFEIIFLVREIPIS